MVAATPRPTCGISGITMPMNPPTTQDSCSSVSERAPVTPVGPSCGICPRMDCAYRAFPPAGRPLAVHEFRKTVSPVPFVAP